MPAADDAVSFDAACALYPDHEIVRYRNRVPSEAFPGGFACLFKVPKAKLKAVLDAGGKPPFWRHGELIDIGPPGGSIAR
jgi:hypothetical protein